MTVETDVQRALAGRDLAALETLAKNADLNAPLIATDAGARTPLDHALRLGDPALVTGLLAVPDVVAPDSLPGDGFWDWAGTAPVPVLRAFLDGAGIPATYRDAAGRTALHAVAAGADPNTGAAVSGWTALITCVASGQDIRWLLAGDRLDVNHRDHLGRTALHLAAGGADTTGTGRGPALELLVADRRTDRTVQDRWGRTALMDAARQGDAAGVALLVGTGGSGAGENLVDADRATALHHAVAAGSTEVVRRLLERPGINLAITDRSGRTAAALASEEGRTALAELLTAAAARAGQQPDRPDREPPPRPDGEPAPADTAWWRLEVDELAGRPEQERRLPAAEHLTPLVRPDATDRGAHGEGLSRAFRRTLDVLGPERRQAVEKKATDRGFGSVDRITQLRTYAAIVLEDHAPLAMGHPALAYCRPRAGTDDAASIARLSAAALRVIALTVSGRYDGDLADVFGRANVDAVKTNYRDAAEKIKQFVDTQRILADRSGYAAEIGLAGKSCESFILLLPRLIDAPDKEAVSTVIHESMHAIPAGIGDRGYANEPVFVRMSEPDKLTNAAHYEVVPCRILDWGPRFPGERFEPAAPVVRLGGQVLAAPDLTYTELARRQASELARHAWSAAGRLHKLWVSAYLHPDWWTAPALARYAGASAAFQQALPYWSKVERLTVHERPGIDPASQDPSRAPVTQLDLALSEGVARGLWLLGLAAGQRLKTRELTRELLRDHAGQGEVAAAADPNDPGSLALVLLRALFRASGGLTGEPDRDVAVVRALAAARTGDFGALLSARRPDDFPF